MSEFVRSIDPATEAVVWEVGASTPDACHHAAARARGAQRGWAELSLDRRIAIARSFAVVVREQSTQIAETISRETGKPLWESLEEAAAVAAKVEISISALNERASEKHFDASFGRLSLRHRPHGVLAILGPFNFPAHLPNGHITPALLAGNAVLFKPSERAPLTGERLVACWRKAGVPDDILIVLQGDRQVGAALAACDIDGLLFTGSAAAGAALQRQFADRLGFLLALELGGNNPIVAWDGDAEAVAALIVQSAFITTGQRCACARRLIVPDDANGARIVEATLSLAQRLRVGAWNDADEPFMGPLVTAGAANAMQSAADALVRAGGRPLLPFARVPRAAAFVNPTIIDVSEATQPTDGEIFAPLLQVMRTQDLDTAIDAANRTQFGLSAALISEDEEKWERFLLRARAGIINRNRPTTGAIGALPFGGVGASGNLRPSAYYAADYCAYPVASAEAAGPTSMMGSLAGRVTAP